MPPIAGLSEPYRVELIGLLGQLLESPGLDPEVARRATWLTWALQGRQLGTARLIAVGGRALEAAGCG